MIPVVNDKLKTIEFDNAGITRKTLQLTEKQIESNSICNKAEESVYFEIITEYGHSASQDLGSFLRTTRTQEDAVNFVLQKNKSNFETFEIPSDYYEVSDIINTLDSLIKTNVFIDIITWKPRKKTNNNLRFDVESFFITILELTRKWDYKPNFETYSQIKKYNDKRYNSFRVWLFWRIIIKGYSWTKILECIFKIGFLGSNVFLSQW